MINLRAVPSAERIGIIKSLFYFLNLLNLSRMKNSTINLKFVFVFFLLVTGFRSYSICPITGDSTVCAGDIKTYSTSLTGPYTYQWNAYGGVAVGSGPSVSITWGNTLTGQVTLVVRDLANNIVCTSLLNVLIMAKPLPWILPSVMVGCGGPNHSAGGPQ